MVEVVVALYRASFLCQYFLEFAQSTSDTKWQMNVFWSKAVKLAHRKSYRVPNRQWWYTLGRKGGIYNTGVNFWGANLTRVSKWHAFLRLEPAFTRVEDHANVDHTFLRKSIRTIVWVWLCSDSGIIRSTSSFVLVSFLEILSFSFLRRSSFSFHAIVNFRIYFISCPSFTSFC